MEIMMLQRKILGVLCALLAPCCIIFGLFGDNLPYWYVSISATYYANSKICMIGLLFATSVFFFSYKGHDWKDRFMSLIQAVSALGIIVFPCTASGIGDRTGLFNLDVSLSNKFHCFFASALFIAFALNITFIFTLGDYRNVLKARRNRIYKTCGALMFLFCAWQAISVCIPYPKWFPMTLINETFLLELFAVAWLTKAQLWLKD